MKALFGSFFQTALYNSLQRRRNARGDLRRRGRLFVQNGAHRLDRSGLVERPLARQQFVENRSECE